MAESKYMLLTSNVVSIKSGSAACHPQGNHENKTESSILPCLEGRRRVTHDTKPQLERWIKESYPDGVWSPIAARFASHGGESKL